MAAWHSISWRRALDSVNWLVDAWCSTTRDPACPGLLPGIPASSIGKHDEQKNTPTAMVGGVDHIHVDPGNHGWHNYWNWPSGI